MSDSIYMTIKQYAGHLSVCERTIAYWLKAGLPSVKIGHVRRVLWREADEWIKGQSVPSPAVPSSSPPTCTKPRKYAQRPKTPSITKGCEIKGEAA